MVTVYATRWGDTRPVGIELESSLRSSDSRKLLLELTGGRCGHWSLDQYLKEGRYADRLAGPVATPLELFSSREETLAPVPEGLETLEWRQWPASKTPRASSKTKPALTTLELFARPAAGSQDITLVEPGVDDPQSSVKGSSTVTTLQGEATPRRSPEALTVLHDAPGGVLEEQSDQGRIQLETPVSPATKRSKGHIGPVDRGRTQTSRSLEAVEQPLGIDLAARGHEVAKLLYAGYGRRLHAAGYDAADVLQEVYKGILIRNRGKCPWDPRKSSFGHYVHMVCGCVVANYHRKQMRLRSREQIGVCGFLEGGGWGNQDVSTHPSLKSLSHTPVTELEEDAAETSLMEHIRSSSRSDPELASLAALMVPTIAQGYTLREMVHLLGAPLKELKAAHELLLTMAATWLG